MTRLEHIGIAVEDPERVAQLYEVLLGVRPYKRERVEREGVQTHFISAESVKLELLEALGPDSPVARYLEKRGEGLHHLAFEVADIDAQMERLRGLGFTPLSDAPRPGADGKRIFFLHPKQTHGVLVEFCQRVPTLPTPTRVPCGSGHLSAYALGDPARPALVAMPGGVARRDADALLSYLEPHFHVVALDVADRPLDALADDVRALLDFFEVAQAHVFGVARSGAVALRFARRHPERAVRIAVHALPPGDAPEATAQVEHPVLVTAADRDETAPPEAALALFRALPHGTLALLPGDGSTLDADLYARLLRRHFEAA